MTEEKLPTGVTRWHNKYKAEYWQDGKRHYCGLHIDQETAVSAIKEDRHNKGFKANPVGRPKTNPD